MRKIIIFLLILKGFTTFGQSSEFRENVIKRLDNSTQPKIKLYNENYGELSNIQFDSIELKIDYLDSLKIQYEILGFQISALNHTQDSVLFEKHIAGYIFPDQIKNFIFNLKDGSFVQFDNVTINLFTGTYTFKTDCKYLYLKK